MFFISFLVLHLVLKCFLSWSSHFKFIWKIWKLWWCLLSIEQESWKFFSLSIQNIVHIVSVDFFPTFESMTCWRKTHFPCTGHFPVQFKSLAAWTLHYCSLWEYFTEQVPQYTPIGLVKCTSSTKLENFSLLISKWLSHFYQLAVFMVALIAICNVSECFGLLISIEIKTDYRRILV